MLVLEAELEGFDRDVGADLIPEAETVCYGLCRFVDADVDSVDRDGRDALGERVSGETKHMNRRVFQHRLFRSPWKCDLYFMWDLRRDVMVRES